MAKHITFMMIGGFLGAGKTTLISRLARHYSDLGKKVGLVTNDQAYGLVDTQHLRSQGFEVGEVPGACFCCKFNDLVETAEKLSEDALPDIIIAEPVGSCTDLMATVIEPMKQIYGERFEVGPLAVLLKPEHGRKILSRNGNVGFSPKAAYIFEKQIEEANIVAINKVDKLTEEQVSELVRLVEEKFPKKVVLTISGRDGTNVDRLVELMDDPALAVRTTMDVDYDIYAEGEAELGWFNCQVAAKSKGEKFDLDQVVLSLVEEIAKRLVESDSEPAHLKVMGQSIAESAVANFVVADEPPELSLSSEIRTDSADIIVNARVGTDPESLQMVIEKSVAELASRIPVKLEISGVQSFKPGRPEPIHRLNG